MTGPPPIPAGTRVVAVGIDVVEVRRFSAALSRSRLLADRLFADDEQVTRSGTPAVGGVAGGQVRGQGGRREGARRAGRHAVARLPGGRANRPGDRCCVVTGTVAAAAAGQGIERWLLSLSHDAGIAAAVVIALG